MRILSKVSCEIAEKIKQMPSSKAIQITNDDDENNTTRRNSNYTKHNYPYLKQNINSTAGECFDFVVFFCFHQIQFIRSWLFNSILYRCYEIQQISYSLLRAFPLENSFNYDVNIFTHRRS